MTENAPKKFRLSFVNAAEDVPRLVRAYGRACQGEFALVMRPPDQSAVLALVTLFTDRGVPTRTFNVYLTGYDIAVVDLDRSDASKKFVADLSNDSALAVREPQARVLDARPRAHARDHQRLRLRARQRALARGPEVLASEAQRLRGGVQDVRGHAPRI